MDNMNWYFPTSIWFGLNRVKDIESACNNLNIKKPLIVTDPGILKTNIISKVNKCLTNEAAVYSDVQGNPTGSNVMNGVKVFHSGKHDGVIAVGGGSGMVLMIEPIDNCISNLKKKQKYDDVIYLTPDGEKLNQKISNEFVTKKNIIILCGHYKGVDQRVRDHLITREISIGDYVLSFIILF